MGHLPTLAVGQTQRVVPSWSGRAMEHVLANRSDVSCSDAAMQAGAGTATWLSFHFHSIGGTALPRFDERAGVVDSSHRFSSAL